MTEVLAIAQGFQRLGPARATSFSLLAGDLGLSPAAPLAELRLQFVEIDVNRRDVQGDDLGKSDLLLPQG
jgi:hypothetical protein